MQLLTRTCFTDDGPEELKLPRYTSNLLQPSLPPLEAVSSLSGTSLQAYCAQGEGHVQHAASTEGMP